MKVKIENSKILLVSSTGIEEVTPKDVFDLIRQLQTALFVWRERTSRKVDEPECY